MLLLCRNSIRIVPEIQAIDIFIIEPYSDMMRVIHGLTGPGVQRETPGYHLTIRGIDGIENGFFQGVGINEFSERLTTRFDDHLAVHRVLDDLHRGHWPFGGILVFGGSFPRPRLVWNLSIKIQAKAR